MNLDGVLCLLVSLLLPRGGGGLADLEEGGDASLRGTPAGPRWREAPPVGSRWREVAPVDLAQGVAIKFGGRSCSGGEERGEAGGDLNRRGCAMRWA
jgi:hypothetical protein